jgi:hypothetical protein
MLRDLADRNRTTVDEVLTRELDCWLARFTVQASASADVLNQLAR